MTTTTRVKIAKYMGDDAYSWAVFLDGRPVMTGLSRSEAQYRAALLQGNPMTRHTDDEIRNHREGKAIIARLADVLEDLIDFVEEIAYAEGSIHLGELDEDALTAVEFRVRRAIAQGLLNDVLRD